MPNIQQITADISVIICAYTFERWVNLLASVKSIQEQTIQKLELIIVIDFNPELFEKARANIENTIVIQNNGTKGLSGARNCGILAAHGRFIAFLDDDAVADKDWLLKLLNSCKDPNVLGAGGKVNPNWTAPKPMWFPDEFGWVIGCSYIGLPTTASSIRNLMGGSMCIRRDVFDVIGGFRCELGRINQNTLGCEETELCIRAHQHWPESKFIYEPDAIIYHSIPPKRGKWSYFLSRCYSEGLSKASISRFIGIDDGLDLERSYTMRVLPQGCVQGIKDTIMRRDLNGMLRTCAIILGLVYTAFGYLQGSVIGLLENKKIPRYPSIN